MQKFNYHTHTYRCGHAQRGLTDEKIANEIIGKEIINKLNFCEEF